MSPNAAVTDADDAPLRFGDPRTVEIADVDPNIKCCFCKRSGINSAEWGSLLKLDDIVVHHFCLLFSAQLEQHGEDNEGICTFMPADIQKEIKRGRKLKCKFCKKTGATIGCAVGKCGHSYHYPCGYENRCLHQFHDQFPSYCQRHKPRQDIPKRFLITDPCQEHDIEKCEACQVDCPICMSKVESLDDAVWPPCCGKQLFHRKCIMQTAEAAGYFFKCPLCNSTKPIFTETMKANGVFVPEQDAAWELEPNAFQELRERYSRCDVQPCLCPQGPEFHENEDDYDEENWLLIRCSSCGASATHVECGHLQGQAEWTCMGCTAIFNGNHEPNSGAENSASDAEEEEEECSGEGEESSGSDESEVEEMVEQEKKMTLSPTVTIRRTAPTATAPTATAPSTDTKDLKMEEEIMEIKALPPSTGRSASPVQPQKVEEATVDVDIEILPSPPASSSRAVPRMKAEQVGLSGSNRKSKQPPISNFFDRLQIPTAEKLRIAQEIQKRLQIHQGEKAKTEDKDDLVKYPAFSALRDRLLKLGQTDGTEPPPPPPSPSTVTSTNVVAVLPSRPPVVPCSSFLSARSSTVTSANVLSVRNGDDHFPTASERRLSFTTKKVKLSEVVVDLEGSSSEDEVIEITDDPDVVIERVISSDPLKSTAFRNMVKGISDARRSRRRRQGPSSRVGQAGSQGPAQEHEVICLDDEDNADTSGNVQKNNRVEEIQCKRRRL